MGGSMELLFFLGCQQHRRVPQRFPRVQVSVRRKDQTGSASEFGQPTSTIADRSRNELDRVEREKFRRDPQESCHVMSNDSAEWLRATRGAARRQCPGQGLPATFTKVVPARWERFASLLARTV